MGPVYRQMDVYAKKDTQEINANLQFVVQKPLKMPMFVQTTVLVELPILAHVKQIMLVLNVNSQCVLVLLQMNQLFVLQMVLVQPLILVVALLALKEMNANL